MQKWEQPGFFRTPTSLDDAKGQLRKEKKLLKQALAARADAEKAQYSLGVKIAEDDIALRLASVAHFETWIQSHSAPRHHATKTPPAQLQREIDEALARREAFQQAKIEEAKIEREMSEAEQALKFITAEISRRLGVSERGPMGLTPDAVKEMPEWRAAKTRVDKAFAQLRAFNAAFVKRFAKELRAERAERTREREGR